MARGNVPATCVAFKRLLRRNDNRSLPLVENICHSMCFWGHKPPLNRQGPDRRLFFCAAFSFTSYYEESDRGQTITAKKTTKSPISNQKTQEYIKGKCPLFIL